jgi:hypothetical protein
VGSWAQIVGENRRRPNEYIVLDRDTSIDGDVILDLYTVSDDDSRVDVNVPAERRISADACVWPDVDQVPKLGSGSDPSVTLDLRRRVHIGLRVY